MLYLRSSLFLLGSQIALIFVVLLLFFSFYLRIEYRYKIGSLWGKFNIWWLGITCKITFNLLGIENIPDKPCVIIANHQSTWESFAFQKIFAHQTWVIKKQLLWIPIFGWGLALLKPVIIDRGEKLKALKTIIKQGVKRVQSGIYLVIFPEGTRQPYGQLGNYQKGGVAIAKQAACDILPVYHNAGKLWAKGSFIKHPGIVTVVIGKPVSIVGESVAKRTQEIRDWTAVQAKNLEH